MYSLIDFFYLIIKNKILAVKTSLISLNIIFIFFVNFFIIKILQMFILTQMLIILFKL